MIRGGRDDKAVVVNEDGSHSMNYVTMRVGPHMIMCSVLSAFGMAVDLCLVWFRVCAMFCMGSATTSRVARRECSLSSLCRKGVFE